MKPKAVAATGESGGLLLAGAVALERMSRNELIRRVRELSETLHAREEKMVEMSRELAEHREAVDSLES